MLKKVLCMMIVALTVMTTLAVANVGAQEVNLAETGKSSYIVGDVDLDGKITIKDVTSIQKVIAGINHFEGRQYEAANTLERNRIDVRDATEIQKYVAGIASGGAVGKEKTYEGYEEIPGPSEDRNPADLTMTEIETAVAERFLELVNEERAIVGAGPLSMNKDLSEAAILRGDEIVESFSHTRPDGSRCFTAINPESGFRTMGENIAYNAGLVHFADFMSDEEIAEEIDFAARFFFGQFKGSSGHYKNMIDDRFNYTGIGVNFVINDGYTECYIAHMFGGK